MENSGAHSKNISSAKEGRARATGALGQSPHCPCLLVPTASQATDETAIGDLPSALGTRRGNGCTMGD